ncbi:MAG: hypothetical protein ACTSYA_02125 [Candidatus Kariarchaeaceae archaeon]
MSAKTSNFLHYFFNISAYMIGYPFMIAVGLFPILLLTMAFSGTESLLDVIVFYGIITLFAFTILLLLSALRIAKKDFYRRKGVNSLTEYYSLYQSKDARIRNSNLQAQKEAKAVSHSEFFDSLSLQETTVLQDEAFLMVASTESTNKEGIATSLESSKDLKSLINLMTLSNLPAYKRINRANLRLFVTASIYSLFAIIVFTSFFLMILNLQLSFLWAFLFFEGMFLTLINSTKSISVPFKSSHESQLHLFKRLLFGKRVEEIDFKVFSLYIGIILIILSLLLFVKQEFTTH